MQAKQSNTLLISLGLFLATGLFALALLFTSLILEVREHQLQIRTHLTDPEALPTITLNTPAVDLTAPLQRLQTDLTEDLERMVSSLGQLQTGQMRLLELTSIPATTPVTPAPIEVDTLQQQLTRLLKQNHKLLEGQQQLRDRASVPVVQPTPSIDLTTTLQPQLTALRSDLATIARRLETPPEPTTVTCNNNDRGEIKAMLQQLQSQLERLHPPSSPPVAVPAPTHPQPYRYNAR